MGVPTLQSFCLFIDEFLPKKQTCCIVGRVRSQICRSQAPGCRLQSGCGNSSAVARSPSRLASRAELFRVAVPHDLTTSQGVAERSGSKNSMAQTRPVWDCHRTADQARGRLGGSVWGGSPMAVPWSVWVDVCVFGSVPGNNVTVGKQKHHSSGTMPTEPSGSSSSTANGIYFRCGF